MGLKKPLTINVLRGKMDNSMKERRALDERRKFSYAFYCPERRSGEDRRVVETLKTDPQIRMELANAV